MYYCRLKHCCKCYVDNMASKRVHGRETNVACCDS